MSTNLKQRPSTTSQQPPPPGSPATSNAATNTHDDNQQSLPPAPSTLPRAPSFSQQGLSQMLASTAHLANLLPTGTLLAFQLLTPIFTNNGVCDNVTRLLTIALLVVLSLSCFLACFTDSFRAPDGQVYYGFATFKGMYIIDTGSGTGPGPAMGQDLSAYRIRAIDWVHSVLSVLVFVVVAIRDKNVVGCLYPSPTQGVEEVLDIVPIGVGLMCSLLFVVFPTRRHGIGYPVSAGKVAED